jgi:hypothetical protein
VSIKAGQGQDCLRESIISGLRALYDSPLRTTRLATRIQQGRRNSLFEQSSYRQCGPETSVAATVQLLGWESYAFDKRRRLDKRGHLDAHVMEVNSKIKRTVSDVPSRDHTIFDP